MTTWKAPFPDSTITGHFGKIRTFKGAPTNPHRGTDWAPGAEKIIPNIVEGEVVLIKWSNIMGWGVVIKTDDNWFVSYHHLHCAKHGINCKGPKVHGEHSPFKSTKVGDRKKLGEPVGRVGNTGSASSGPHLHACLSKTIQGAWSGRVFDLYKHIKDQEKSPQKATQKAKISETKPKTTQKAKETIVSPSVTIVYACPHCKKELK